jgi:Membrane protein of 12 TMs
VSWREAIRLAGPAYTELAFQATFAMRQGNLPPSPIGGTLAARARRRVWQSKLLVGALVSLMALGAGAVLRPSVRAVVAPALDPGLYVTAVVGAALLLELALLWWTGLQVLPTYLSSRVVPFLATMPVPEKTLRRVAALLVLRLFDGPALACLVVTPIAVALGVGAPLAGVAIVPGVAVVLLVAVALALRTGEFFVVRIQGAHAGPGQTALRWAYLLLWAVPAFALYGFLAAAPSFLGLLSSLRAGGYPAELVGLLLSFPMPLAALPGLVGHLFAPPAAVGAGVVAAAALYALGAGGLAWWLRGAPLRLALSTPFATLPRPGTALRLAPGHPAVAVIRKDLRIASRTPGFAFVILLPLLDALALGLLTFAAAPPPDTVFNLAAAAVSTSALLATFFGPALFALEVMGYTYVRTLPLPDRSVVLGKVMLVTMLYAAAAGIVILFTLPRVFAPLTFLGFVAAELPAVVAAALLEFGLLFRHARRRGLPVVNLYTGAWWATLVAFPGLLVAGVPLAVFQDLRGAGSPVALPALALLGLVELGAVLPLALSGAGGKRP